MTRGKFVSRFSYLLSRKNNSKVHLIFKSFRQLLQQFGKITVNVSLTKKKKSYYKQYESRTGSWIQSDKEQLNVTFV